MPDNVELSQWVASPGQKLLDAGFLPRQVAAMIGLLLQMEAQGFYAGIAEAAGAYNDVIASVYGRRDEMFPNTVGFVPTEKDQARRRTKGTAKQLQIAQQVLDPFMGQVRRALRSGGVDPTRLEAISMALLAASNDTGIGNLRPEDGPAYFQAMILHSLDSLDYLDRQRRSERTRKFPFTIRQVDPGSTSMGHNRRRPGGRSP